MVTPEQHELLQRYIDGDLSEVELTVLQGQLAQDQGLLNELQVLQRLQALIVDAGEYHASQLDSEAMFTRISAAVYSEATATVSAPAQAPGFFERLLRGGFWMPAGGALAVTAALLLTIYLPVDNTALHGGSGAATTPAESDERAAVSGGEQSTTPAALPGRGSEVVQVDFGNNAGTVFEIALADGASTPVVWINDEEE